MARANQNKDDNKKAGSPYKWVCMGKHSVGVLGRIIHKGESITEAEYKKLPTRVKGYFEKAPVLPEPEAPKTDDDTGTGEEDPGKNENNNSGKGDEDPKGGKGVGGNGEDGNND